MKDLKISVIIPVYNSSEFLQECFDSILNQTIAPNIEVIIINDCSKDNSLDIIKEYTQKHSNFKLINNQTNIKQGPSRNEGVKIAQGKYLFFLDSDDYLLPDGLEILYKQANNNNSDVAISNYIIFEDASKPFKKHTQDIVTDFKFSKFAIPLYAWGKLFKRSFWIENNFLFEAIYAEDLKLIPTVLEATNKISINNDNVCVYRYNPNSLTHQYHDYIELISILEGLYQYFYKCGKLNGEQEAFLLSNFYNLTKVIKTSTDRYKFFCRFKKLIPKLKKSQYMQPPLVNASKLKKLRLIYKTNGIYLLLKPDMRQIIRNRIS